MADNYNARGLEFSNEEQKRSASVSGNTSLVRVAGQQIVLYDYKPNRKPENAEKFLEDFSGWLHADGYQGYHRLPENIRIVGCWAHARRKFNEALQVLPEESRKDSQAAIGERYCTELFRIEKQLAVLSPEDRYEQRLKQEKPVLDAMLVWANDLYGKTAGKSALGKALYYLTEQWPYLVKYLEDGRLELSNNRAERSMPPFTGCCKMRCISAIWYKPVTSVPPCTVKPKRQGRRTGWW